MSNNAPKFDKQLENPDSYDFKPFETDFANSFIRQRPGNPLGLRIGNLPNGNYCEIETDGTIEFNGDATVWEDLRVPVTTAKPGNVVPGFESFLAAGGLKTYLFDGGGRAEEIHFVVQIPHSYKIGTNITPHIHWTPTDTGSGNVKWSLEYTWQQRNATFGASTTIHIIDAASGTAWEHLRADFAAIDGSAITLTSSMLVCRLFRDSGDDDDTYTSDAALLEIDFHYEIDTVGSRNIVIK